MRQKIKFICICIIIFLVNMPVYGSGYEEVSLFKIVFQLVFYLAIFIAIILLSIYGTKFIAKNYKRVVSSKYMELIDVLNIPGNSKIVIVRINKKIYVLSISNNDTAIIDKFNEEEFQIIEESFDNYFDKYLDKWNNSFKCNRMLSKFHLKKDKEDMKDETKD